MANDILVFANMMKTAGSSLIRTLVGIFGPRLHMVPGGLAMQGDSYDVVRLRRDYKLLGGKLELLTGHPLRPHVDFGEFNTRMK